MAGAPQTQLSGVEIGLPDAGSSHASDYWDVNGNTQANGHDSEFSGLAAEVLAPDKKRQKNSSLLALVLLLGVVAYAGYLYLVEERDPIAEVMALVAGEAGEDDDASDIEADATSAKSAASGTTEPEPEPAAKPVAPKTKTVAGNPYWHLPNAILGAQAALERTWMPEEEEEWRAGLAHRYVYQHWRAVQEVKRQRLKGSEAILWEALNDGKFWTRAEAAVGLADFGVPISLQSLDSILQNARSELIADYFERIVKRCSPGQCFVLRQVIRLLDAKGRIVALEGIARSKDTLRDLYLAAATQDPDKHVQRWVRTYLDWKPLDPDKYNRMLAIVAGTADGKELVATAKREKRALHASGKAKLVTDQDSMELSTEEDLDKDLEQLDKDSGDVEIYEPGVGAATMDSGDNESFE